MPSIDKVSRLFKALAHDDVAAAKLVASQIAAVEEQKGHFTAARILRGSLANGTQAIGAPSFLSSALLHRGTAIRFDDVALRSTTRRGLEELVKEFRVRDLLAGHRLRRRGKILFHGPPGCGKSLSAQALANESGLPLYVVRFDAVIGAYLGQTALNLRQLFSFAEGTECVLLFDEIDALGKRRGSSTDVGELDRIVIALMQELELSEIRGFVVATSNLPDTLDLALWRRFDLDIAFPAPTRRELLSFANRKARDFDLPSGKGFRERIADLRNYADVERVVEDEARRVLLRSA